MNAQTKTATEGLFAEMISPPHLVFVDFDHTLFGGNSTEIFISSLKPSALVSILDLLVRGCIPWRLLGRERSFRVRDYAFCRILFALYPAALSSWEEDAPTLFDRMVNRQLQDGLSASQGNQIAIITFGMEPIIRPMLLGSRWQEVPLLSTPHRASRRYFQQRKLGLAIERFGAAALPNAMLITDSKDDIDLLNAVGFPVLVPPYHADAAGPL